MTEDIPTDYDVEQRVDVTVSESDNSAVGYCRFCQTEFTSEVNEHRHHCKQRDHPPWEDNDQEEAASDDGYFLTPGYHEFKAYLKYDMGNEPADLTPYFGLNSLQKEHDFGADGSLEQTFETPDGEEWIVDFSFKRSGLAPWDHRDFQLSNVREYILKVRPAGVPKHDEALRSASFQVSPRWPDLESKGTGPDPSNPHDIVGVDVEASGSGLPFEFYPELFYRAMATLRKAQGKTFSNPTYIEPEKVQPAKVHHASNVIDAELYVRIGNQYSGPIYAIDGPIHRLSLLLASDRDGYAKTIRDDRERQGHYHTATIGSMRAGQFIAQHEVGKEIKHYFVKHPDAVEGPLQDPKLGVSMQHSVTEDTVYFEEIASLERELDEALLSVLNIAGLPTRPDHGIYTEDPVFEPTGERRLRTIVDDGVLPRLETEQDVETEVAVQNASEVDAEIWGELLSDGGQVAPKDLAERLGRNLDHVYRRLRKMSGVLQREYGAVKFASKHIAQSVWKRLDQVQQSIQANIDGAVEDLMEAHRLGDEDSWWGHLRTEYGAQIDDRDEDELGDFEVSVQYKARSYDKAKDIAREFAWAYPGTTSIKEFLREAIIRIPIQGESSFVRPVRTSSSIVREL